MIRSSRASAVLLVLSLVPATRAQDCLPMRQLTPPGSYILQDDYGSDVVVKDGVVLVGAAFDDNVAGTDAGSGLLFDVVTGNFVRALFPAPTTTIGGECGTSVDIDGGLAVMGAPSYDGGIMKLGSAWIHDVATGAIIAELQPANPGPAYRFGQSVAISGNRILVGTPNDYPGSVWVFDATGQELFKFYDETLPPTMSDDFGWAVDVDGNVGIAGGPRDSQAGPQFAGIAKLFDVTTGQELHRLQEPTPISTGYFGWAVAIDGNRALVRGGLGVYLYDVPTGQVLRTFTSPVGTPDSLFGRAVALDGDRVVISRVAYGSAPGTVWVYDAVTGELQHELHAPVPSPTDGFGRKVDLDGSLLAVSAGDPGFFPTQFGKAYLIDLDSDGFETVGVGLAGAAGVPALDGSGALVPGGAFSVTVTDAAPNAATYLILGFGELSTKFMGGVLVPTPDVIKFGPPTNVAGGFVINTHWPAGIGCIPIYSQVWITDVSAPFGFSATNGMLVVGH